METDTQRYVIYLTAEANGQSVGTVVNIVIWDGKSPLFLASGQAMIADPDGKYRRGSIYTPPAS